MSKKIIASIIGIVVAVAAVAAWLVYFKSSSLEVQNFEECIKAGYPVMESYPRQCKATDGKTFTEDIGNELEKADLIKTDNPRPNQEVENPLFVKGEARGNWYFEASFPVKLFDDNDFLLGVIPAQALGDWMTEDFVAFSATLLFAVPSTPKGRIDFRKRQSVRIAGAGR